MKRSISLLLCLAMLLASFAGCSNGEEKETTPSVNPTSSNESETTPEETEPEDTLAKANIPEGTTYGGMTYTVAAYGESSSIWSDVDWSATEITAEVLNDAVYNRTQQVEDLLDIDIVTAYTTGRSDVATLTKSVQSQDNAYQLYNLAMGNVFGPAQNGQLQELNSFAEKGTLDLSSSWWDQNIINDLSINNMIFALTGDIGTMYKKSIGSIMFNKVILLNNDLDDPYELMREGNWTIDKMVEMGQKVSEDLDGNGVMDQNDQYGLICFCDMLALAMIGSDIQFISKDDTDTPYNSFYSERTVSVVEKLATLMYDPNITYSWSKNGVGEDPAFKMFQTDKSLFYYGELHSVVTMREMESEFGILPMPKYDENQDGYHHCINPNAAAVYIVPITNVDYESSGYIMDALGAASKNELTPAYFEKTLQGRVSRDVESTESLEIIINTINYDLGYLGGFGFSSFILGMADAYNTDLTSTYQKQEKLINKMIERTVDAFADLKESLE